MQLIISRLIYPDHIFEMSQLPAEQTALWKRLCQNLGILCGKAPRPPIETQALSFSEPITRISLEGQQALLSYGNEKAPIVPHRLLQSLISS